MKHYILLLLALLLPLSSCELLLPDEVQNPNVEASDFATSPQAMKVWVNGVNANFAVAVATFAEYTGLLSDDLMNNSSRSSKTYDQLDIHYTDGEVASLSTHVGKMLQMTDFGLRTIAQNDALTTQHDLFTLHYIRAYAYLLGGENFVALPKEARGEVLEANGLLRQALVELEAAAPLATTAADEALVLLLQARAARSLGQLTEAASYARRSLQKSNDLVVGVQFDALNGFGNSLHEYVASNLFTILERMQFQAQKFPMAEYWNQSLSIAKSEEVHLILAEAAVNEGHVDEAREHLHALLALVATRPASVSMTSVTPADLEPLTEARPMLETLYLLRQEVFFGEGRRSSDLGIRLPMSEVEYNEQGQLPAHYTQPVIPAYLQSIRTEIDQHQDLNQRLVEGR